MNETTMPHKNGKRSRRKVIGLLLALVVGGVALGVGVLTGFIKNPMATASTSDKKETSGEERLTAKTIRPKFDPNLKLSTEQVGTIEPWYSADLRARASGLVKRVTKEMGDVVRRGELLVEIDVPESVQDVAQKASMIQQRRQELRVSEAKYKDAKAAREVAQATIKQRKSEVVAATATRDFRKKRFERFRELGAKGSAVQGVVDEEERDYLASEAVLESTSVGVEKAIADLSEAESKVEAAGADIELRKTMIEVAITEWERARIVADYGRIVAPFDGIVVRRNVDPGSFVQNATSGNSETLISVARLDLLTITTRFPDTVAPFVNNETPVRITIDELPDLVIHTKVTRFSPSIQNLDRTVRVEADVFNGTEADYRKLFRGVVASEINEIMPFDPLSRAIMLAVSETEKDAVQKGDSEPFAEPIFRKGLAANRRLMPGMIASMRLSLESSKGNYTVPSSAIYSRSGKPFILLVKDGVTKEYPVVVQLNDGRNAKVMLTEMDKQSKRPSNRELTEQDEIVLSRQTELGDGRPVKTVLAE